MTALVVVARACDTQAMRLAWIASVGLMAFGCGSSGAEPDANPACEAGATRCGDAVTVETCVVGADGLRWEVTETCAANHVCDDATATCVVDPELDPEELAQLADLEAFIADVAASGGLALDQPVDGDALLAEARAIIEQDVGGVGFARAIRHVNLAYADGHVSVFNNDTCGTAANPLYFTSLQDACTQPFEDHVVVNRVGDVNPLGLQAGDEILAWNGRSGAELEDAVLTAPLCASASASASARRALAGTTLLAVVQPGDTLSVRHVGGGEEEIVVGAPLDQRISCRNPLATPRPYVALASWLDEAAGIALIDLPSLYPTKEGADYQETLDNLRAEIAAALATVPGASARIWDARGNTGGFQEMGLRIVSGFAGVGAQPMGDCEWRQAGSDPFVSQRHVDYDVIEDAAMAFDGVNVVIIDGLTHSAGDWLAWGAKDAAGSSAVVVGSPSSGAFGAALIRGYVTPGRGLYEVISPLRCEDQQGNLLEGRAVEPDVVVELTPEALAAGDDNVRARALAEAQALLAD